MKSKKVNIDFLINNAGHLKNETFDKTSYESFKETYDVNVTTTNATTTTRTTTKTTTSTPTISTMTMAHSLTRLF